MMKLLTLGLPYKFHIDHSYEVLAEEKLKEQMIGEQ